MGQPGELLCDDEYIDEETDESIVFESTTAAHFKDMPPKIKDMKKFLESIKDRKDIKVIK